LPTINMPPLEPGSRFMCSSSAWRSLVRPLNGSGNASGTLLTGASTSNVFDTRMRGAPHSGQNLNAGVTDAPHDSHLSVTGSARMRARMPSSASRISAADA
jgi:hypothetical protein